MDREAWWATVHELTREGNVIKGRAPMSATLKKLTAF